MSATTPKAQALSHKDEPPDAGSTEGFKGHHLENVRRQYPARDQAAQLLPDSRTTVVQRQRAAEKAAAPLYVTSPARAAELREIAAKTRDHQERIRKALATGELTAPEAVRLLDTLQPHARLCELRQSGRAILPRWVLAVTAHGHTRRVKAYSLAGEGGAA